MKTLNRFSNIVIFMVLFIGCSIANPSNTPIPVTTQPSKPAPTAESFESSSIIIPTLSFTSSPDPTPNQTQVAIEQTVLTLQAEVAQFPHLCKNTYDFPSSGRFSPDRLWLEEMCFSKEDNDLILTFSNRETRVMWKLLYHDYIPKLDYAPDGGLVVTHWSKDGKYAYFYSHGGGDGGECFYVGDSGFGLFRLDLQTGQIKTILPTNEDFWWYGFSVSPIDNYLVYGERARDWKILDIRSGESIRVNSAKAYDEDGGGFVWSPDGLEFVYSAVVSQPPSNRESATYSLRWVDAQSGNEQILLESQADCFLAISWNESEIITVQHYDENGPTLIEFDLNSNSIISPTATATP